VATGPIRQYIQPPRNRYSQLSVSTGLLRTCTQVRKEAIKNLYGSDRFHIESTNLTSIHDFIHTRGNRNLEQLKDISINFEVSQSEFYGMSGTKDP
jgi:hypothetical protein